MLLFFWVWVHTSIGAQLLSQLLMFFETRLGQVVVVFHANILQFNRQPVSCWDYPVTPLAGYAESLPWSDTKSEQLFASCAGTTVSWHWGPCCHWLFDVGPHHQFGSWHVVYVEATTFREQGQFTEILTADIFGVETSFGPVVCKCWRLNIECQMLNVKWMVFTCLNQCSWPTTQACSVLNKSGAFNRTRPKIFISNSQDQFCTTWPTGIAGERQEGQRWKWRWERRQRKSKGEREEEGKGEVKEGERKEGERKVQEGQKREGERQRERQRSWQGKEPQKSAFIFVVSSKREESGKVSDYDCVWLCIYPVPSSKPVAILLLGLHVVQVCNLCV